MKLSKKLPLAFAAVSLLSASAGIFGIYRLTEVTSTYHKVIQLDYRNARTASEILVEFKTQVQEWKDVLLRGKDPEQLNKYWAAFQEHEKSVVAASKRLQSALPDGRARETVGEFTTAHAKMGEDYRRGYAAFVAAGFEASAGDAAVKGKDRPPAAMLKQLEESIVESTASAVSVAESNEKRGIFISLAVMLASVVVSLLAGWRVSRTLILQLGGEPDYAASVTERIASGDLGSRVDLRARDRSSLLFSIKEMQDSLANIVGEVRRGTESIATASGQIAAGNLDLSSRTEQQAGSLAETASSMEELTATVKNNAENARQANNLALSASRVALRGGEVVGQVVQTMGSINDSAKQIVEIISVIDGIAFQTNILALNAAVEAARAGEQGRGFAVVAAEVRNLAQRSAGAAKEIKALIGDSVDKIQAGSKLVSDAGSTMDEIVESVKHVTAIMSEMLVASEEQSAGIEQINLAISQMDEATQQNAALVEESSAAATTMSDQASRLSQNVAVFRLGTQREVLLLA